MLKRPLTGGFFDRGAGLCWAHLPDFNPSGRSLGRSRQLPGQPGQPPAGASRASLDSVRDHFCCLLVEGRQALVVAAGRLLAFVRWDVGTERIEELVVDVARLAAVRTDEHDDGTIVGRPHGEHAVAAVQVAAADVIEVGAGEPVSRGVAAQVGYLTKDAERGISSSTAECSELLVGDLGQRDFDRRASCSRSWAISALTSSPSATVFPAR